MILRHFSAVPFVLCNLMAADLGAAAGGGGAQAPAQPKTLAEAISMLGASREETRQANERATKAEAAEKRVQGQFEALTAIAKADSKKVIQLRGEVVGHVATIAKRDEKITSQTTDITRLEAIIGAGGLSASSVVPPADAPVNADAQRDALVTALNEAKTPLARGLAAADLRAFDDKAKAAKKSA